MPQLVIPGGALVKGAFAALIEANAPAVIQEATAAWTQGTGAVVDRVLNLLDRLPYRSWFQKIVFGPIRWFNSAYLWKHRDQLLQAVNTVSSAAISAAGGLAVQKILDALRA